jgi:ubiquinone/menaquinone biosynthesis C-methylase UbiE
VSLYDRWLLPRLTHWTCGLKPTMRQRAKIVPEAAGRVLEVGFGSGLNLDYYDPARVRHVWALEPAKEMWDLARDRLPGRPFGVEFVEAGAEAVPLEDGSADTVLVTYTLCTIPDAAAALREMRRVLKPGGQLLFCEHGEAPDASVRRWQNRLGGGCNLNRRIPELIRGAGFRIGRLETMYLPGFRPATFNYWGAASLD